MKIISTETKKITIDALDIELPELFIDFEMARRIGGTKWEVVCHTFKNEEKRDTGQVIITNIPSLKIMITKTPEIILLKSNFFAEEIQLGDSTTQVTEPFVKNCIRLCYEQIGCTFQ